MKEPTNQEIPFEINETVVEGITKIANTLLKKKHPDMSLEEWQCRYFFWANKLFYDELKKK